MKTLAAAVLLAAGTGAGLWWLSGHRPEPPRRAPRELGPVPIGWRPLEPVAAEAWVEAYGTLEAARTARLAFELAGPVREVRSPWRPGEVVREGELLARLDTDWLKAERGRAQALLDEARAALESAGVEREFAASGLILSAERLELAGAEERRANELAGSGDVSASRRDAARRERVAAALAEEASRRAGIQAEVAERSARARVAQAEAQLLLAGEQLERAELRAPFDGRLDRRGPEVGTYLLPGEAVAELLDLSTVRLIVPVDERDARGLSVGAPAFVRLPAPGAPELEGRVGAIGVSADPRTRAVAVEVELDNRAAAAAGLDADGDGHELLRAGAFAAVRLLARRIDAGLVVHEDELRWIDGVPCAFAALESGAGLVIERRELSLGSRVRTSGGWVGHEVRGGLRAGETLVTAPIARLQGGEAAELGERREPGR